jgi:hypothetical protein
MEVISTHSRTQQQTELSGQFHILPAITLAESTVNRMDSSTAFDVMKREILSTKRTDFSNWTVFGH